MMTIGKDAKDEKKEGQERTGRRSGSFHNAVQKGKDMLGLKGKGEKEKAGDGSAIADD